MEATSLQPLRETGAEDLSDERRGQFLVSLARRDSVAAAPRVFGGAPGGLQYTAFCDRYRTWYGSRVGVNTGIAGMWTPGSPACEHRDRRHVNTEIAGV